MDINRVNRIAFTQKSVREAVAYMKRNKNRDPAPYLVAKFGKALKHKQNMYSASSTAPFGRDSQNQNRQAGRAQSPVYFGVLK